jgi:putative sulfurtransferase DndC
LSKSILETRTFVDIFEEIRTVYLNDNRPWIIGFSGGKDSTCLVQLVWRALSTLPPEKLTKKIYVISSNTLVEAPQIAERITDSLDRMEKFAKKIHLPIGTNLLRPPTSDTFWVRLLGLGYPAPTTMFRWCTDMLKISNADKFIQDTVSEHGEAIVLLGMRRNESTTRGQVMELYKIDGSVLSRHSKFDQTYVYTPLEDFSAEDVWNYLLENENPWGEENRDLLAMYQDANASECPLVIDTTTPSCGGGRFGCWTCTVVDKQNFLTNMIENDEKNEWMEVLAELRQKLKDTQEPEAWEQYREKVRRSGHVDLKAHDIGLSCDECGGENSSSSTKCKNDICSKPLILIKKCKECNTEYPSTETRCKHNACSKSLILRKKCKECGADNYPKKTKCKNNVCSGPLRLIKKCKECGTQNSPDEIKCKDCSKYLVNYTPGPYKMDFRRDYLRDLLEGQIKIQEKKNDPDYELILEEEIHEIQRIWRMEQGDWKNSVYQIYHEVTGKNLFKNSNEMGNFNETEQELLEKTCSTHNIPFKLVSNLLNLELQSQGANRHTKVFDKIKTELSKEWRDVDDKNEFEKIMIEVNTKKEIRNKASSHLSQTQESENQ